MNASNVTYGKPKKAGAIFTAPVGATLPTSVTDAKDPAFKGVGFISEDGVTNSNSAESTDIKAWGGDIVMSPQEGKEDKFHFVMIEALGKTPKEVVYGTSNVTGDINSGITVKANNSAPEERSWIIDINMRNGVITRIVIPKASVAELGDIVYKDNEAVGYEVTISAYPDADGNTHYEYSKAVESPVDPDIFTVSFNTDGGSTVNSQNVPDGSLVTEPADPTKDGYTFGGWYSDSELTTAWDFADDTVTGNMILYAKWTA